MFHLFHWILAHHWNRLYLDNGQTWIEVTYTWTQQEGMFFLIPVLDTNNNTIKYYAFEDIAQRERFVTMQKIQGIWGKNAYLLATLPIDEVKQAVEEFDAKYFQSLPGIGAKTAKRILIELKQTLSEDDMKKLSIDDKLYKDITESLKSLWYNVKDVQKLLPNAPYALEEKNISSIMKWLIDHL